MLGEIILANEFDNTKLSGIDQMHLKQIGFRLKSLIESRAILLDTFDRAVLHKKCYGTVPPETHFQGKPVVEGQIYFYIEED